MACNYYESLPVEAKARYRKKLDVIGIKECPYQLAAGYWTDDPTKWPDLQWPDIVGYMIDQPGTFVR